MRDLRQLRDEMGAAVAAEQDAWSKVKDALPGMAKYDVGLWEKWKAAVKRADDARRALQIGMNPEQ